MNSLKLSELINPTPRQLEFLHAFDHFKFPLYGGAAGGGKSYILRWAALRLLLKIGCVYKVPNVNVGLFCEDYPTLRDRQLSKIAFEFPKAFGRLVDSRDEGYVFKLRDELGAGRLSFRNLDDPSKYNSTEFAAILVDELTRNKELIFHELRKRLRWPGLPADFKFPFAGGTNPGGIGHKWVKQFWIDRNFPPELQAYAHEFAFVQAKAQDNPHNPPKYYEDLKSLPPEMARAYAEGDWDLFQGQFFSEFRRHVHVVKPFTIPSWWERFASFDWGFASPACTLWHAVSPEGRVFTYRESYERNRDTPWLAKRNKELSEGETLRYCVADPNCRSTTSALGFKGPSILDVMATNGWPMILGDNSRNNGWARVREYMAWESRPDGLPMWQVFETCTNTITTIPALTYDEHDVEDLDTDGEDHAADSLRYGLMTRPKISIVPLDVMPDEYAEATARAEHYDKNQWNPKTNPLS